MTEVPEPAKVTREALQTLLEVLKRRGYRVIGPTLRDKAIVYDDIAAVADLPKGWSDEQDGGHYRLKKRDDEALFGYAVLAPSASAPDFPDILIPSHAILPWVLKVASFPVPAWIRNLSASIGSRLPCRSGYADAEGRLFPGHLLAATFTLALLLPSAFFGWVVLWFSPPAYPPALCSILFLLAFLVWAFNGLCFYFDYWRIPLLTCSVLIALSAGFAPIRFHGYEFRAWPMPRPPVRLEPEDLVRGEPRVIIVAAEGGGIQAAAWTAEILMRLSAIPGFDCALKAISAVSGGSVGAMHYVTRANPGPGPANLRARASLLNPIGWSLAFRDSRRLRYPGLHHLLAAFEARLWPEANLPDRGAALERQLSRFLTREDTFEDWRERARKGLMPAVFFNTTVVSSGRPAPFSNIDLPPSLPVQTFQRQFEHDASVASAVRLSAAFPLVSPAASPSSPAWSHLELVDGGYFDNTGVHTALAFLAAALPELERSKASVLLIRIKSFPPEPNGPPPAPSRFWRSPEWLQQIAAPLGALLSTRTSGQDNSTARALDLTAIAYASAINFSWIDARFPALSSVSPAQVPLNWHLTRKQQRWIDDAWTEAGPGIERQVRAFLGR